MRTFRVWAPLAKKVEVQVDGKRHAMSPEEKTESSTGGWWRAEVETAEVNSDYGFFLDGKGPLPDPCSLSQPEGIHGLSRVVDVSAFKWTDAKWQPPPLSSAIIYELHVGTFTSQGTFKAAIEKLDHLFQLGVTHIELMPVNEFSGSRGWGYDGVDLFAAHHAYGGPFALARFVDACHARGLAVLLDVVYNHVGPAGNHLGDFGPYFTSRYSTPWGKAVNFDDADSDEVRRFFCDNALMWLRDFHFDGLRLDAVHAMLDRTAEHFLEQLGREVKQLSAQLGRLLVVIAESDLNDPRLLWPRERGGFALNAQWSDDFHHSLHSLLTDERDGYYADFGSLAQLAKALRQAFVYDGCYSSSRRRRHGRKPDGLSGHHFLAYLQNHDQIGNRAKGERSAHLMNKDRLKIAAALVLTSPFVPMLFQGEEWAASTPFLYFTNHREAELAEKVRDGRRKEFAAFGWKPEEIPDPQAEETFLRSKLRWEEILGEPHAEILEWHRKLIRLRRTESAMTDGRLDLVNVQFDDEARWLVMERGPITVACNFGSETQDVPLRTGHQRMLTASSENAVAKNETLSLPRESVAILKVD
jgi:maltooligosyltrehalose trehalohydrolase